MPPIEITPQLQAEYEQLFDSCEVRPEHACEVESLVARIVANQCRYSSLGSALAVPWYFIGVIHFMEASLDFAVHLHNGDPLTARTIHVPSQRPREGEPPFKWEESATDAIRLARLPEWHDWSIPGILYRLEAYNGFGYRTRHPEVMTPYLWSYSNHYTSGKYVEDGFFSASTVAKQCGAAVLLRRMSESGAIRFDTAGIPFAAALSAPESSSVNNEVKRLEPLIHFSESMKFPLVETVQRALNRFPGVFVKVDGIPGKRTSDAFKRITGHYLIGDPR